jgi:hypothetical protein
MFHIGTNSYIKFLAFNFQQANINNVVRAGKIF